MINIIHQKVTPLCFLSDGKLVGYQYGKIVIYEGENEVFRVSLFSSFREYVLGRFKFISRILRLGVRAAVAIDDERIVLSIGNVLYELNITTGYLSKGYFCGKGVRPLVFSTVTSVNGFEDGIYFGGYLSNMKKKPVNVYHRIGEDDWRVVYTFSEGDVNHVHNIVPDAYRNCLWIFTGDFGEASAIWKVTDNFKKVERVLCDNQKYRGCVAFALPEGLLYATDTPFADDYINLLNVERMVTKELFPIDGSCIYGCKWKNNFVFSSTVEGDGRNTTKIEFLFGRKRGAGIKNDYVHMYMGNLKDGFREIYKEKKDRMPIYTFQFGAFKFPYGVNNGDTLYFQPVATKKNDLSLMKYVED